MHLVPRTMAARLVAVLLLGLVLGQLFSFIINFLDRGAAFYRSTTLQVAERIADIAKALDTVGPQERARIVGRLTNKHFKIALAPQPEPEDGVSERPYARAFEALLQRRLGPGWPLNVIIHRRQLSPGGRAPFFSETPANAPDRYLTLQLFYLAPRGFAFVTHIRLHDGSWVRFSAPLPYEQITRLYILVPRLLTMLGVVVALLLIAVRHVTDPMKRMAEAALALGQRLDRVPIAESGPVEIRTTARALNVMQLRLQEYVRDRAAMLAALSHDLKTFITRLRLRTELLPESGHRDRLIGDLGEMATMVDATLDYLHGIDSSREWAQFDLTALVESIRIDAEELGWEVTVSGAALSPFYGNPQELRRAITNLVDNAVKYGGSAAIHIADDADELTIAICDPGPGVPPEERDRVFEPFYRGRSAPGQERAGTGLGLHIARTIARAHGGEVIIEREVRGGFCVAIHLPRAKASDRRGRG